MNKEISPYVQHEIENNFMINNIINNRDLFVLSLLEYICNAKNISHEMFYVVCVYLKKNGLIGDIEINESIGNKIKNNNIYSELINSIANSNMNKNFTSNILEYNIENSGIKNVEYENVISRYKKDFIEIERIGDGGFGSVFKVINKIDDSKYAIKKIKIENLDKEKSKYYLNEVRILSKLNYKHIIRYYTTWIEFDYDNINNSDNIQNNENNQINKYNINNLINLNIKPTLYIQMELCDSTLEKYIRDRNYNNNEIILKDELLTFKQLLKGIKYIHNNNIIHGDVTPLNIFMNKQLNIKIGDFGLAKKIDKSDSDTNFGSYGNIEYMAKEQIENKICNKKSDIYSIGIIYLELINKFLTKHEKLKVLSKIKNCEYNRIYDENNKKFINMMINDDYNERSDVENLIDFFNEYIIINL